MIGALAHGVEIAVGVFGLVSVAGLALAIVLAVKVRRLSESQTMVLGPYGTQDVVNHAASLQAAFEQLAAQVDDTSQSLEAQLRVIESRLECAISFHALVRYDAYGEMSGQQSTSLALLDTHLNGVVLSSIAHRDTARLYCRAVTAGKGEHELSPEENEAIQLACAAPVVAS